MLTLSECGGEFHAFGGDGEFIYAHSEDITDTLIEKYGGKVKLIYLDPPFGTGATFEFKDKTAAKAYSDILDREECTSLMRKVLICCRELLSEDGSIYLHIDYRLSGVMRRTMDEIFGEANLMNEIIWSYKSGGRAIKHFSRKHDTILFYRKSKSVYFNIKAAGVMRGSDRRNHMKRRADEDGRIYYAIRSNGKEYRYYEDDLIYPSDVWNDIEHLHQRDPERTGYATQKPEALLKRIISVSTEPDDLVMDLFAGSGTTAAAAVKLGRRFVIADCSMASMLASRRRILTLHPNDDMLSDAKPFTVNYASAPSALTAENAEKLIDMEPAEGGFTVNIHKGGEEGCAYAACGSIRDGVFHARDYVIKPVNSEKLFVREGEALHLVDYNCSQGYFDLA